MEKLKEKIKKQFLEISTVDSYQGREKDIIIYSVTSTKNFDFVEDENRMNVAFTRAKKKLIVIGNENAILKNSPAGLLSKYISYSKSKYGYYDCAREQTSPDQEGRDWSNTIIEL